jgi:photosynthetic reaction center H subunit
MIRGAVGHLDVAQLVLYAFWIFLACLIWYLRGEDRREGYPLESEQDGGVKDRGFLFIPSPKTFNLAGGVRLQAPSFVADTRQHKSAKVELWPGAPYEPVGDPMLAEVGPGSYALRPDVSEKNAEGHDLILPMRVATNFAVSPDGGNPLGFSVMGADGKIAGVIKDIWVDRSESVIRYYEVQLEGAGSVLTPVHFCDVNFHARRMKVKALLAHQFANVPTLKSPDSITMLEEEKVSAYYGAGALYATPERAEPLL